MVELEGACADYTLPPSVEDVKAVARESRKLLNFLPDSIGFPLMGFIYLAPLCEFLEQSGFLPSFTLALIGKTSSLKTVAATLALSHFGSKFNYEHAPASFINTPNSIRAKAFLLKDLPLLVDDFRPGSTKREADRMVDTAKNLIFSWGNHEDRSRLNADLSIRAPQPPRGLGIITGEQLPEDVESMLARVYRVEMKSGDIQIGDELNRLQKEGKNGTLAAAMRGYIEWLLPQCEQLPAHLGATFEAYRSLAMKHLVGAHGRFAEAVAFELVGIRCMLDYWYAVEAITQEEHTKLWTDGCRSVMANITVQKADIADSDPVNMFLTALRDLRASGELVIKSIRLDAPSDTVLSLPEVMGYSDEQFYYLIPGAVYGAVHSYYGKQGRSFSHGQKQVNKYLAERDYIIPGRDGLLPCKTIQGKTSRYLWMPRAVLDGGEIQAIMEE